MINVRSWYWWLSIVAGVCTILYAHAHGEWSWHWWLFIVAIVPCTIMTQFRVGMANSAAVARYGPSANVFTHPVQAIFWSIIFGAIYAAMITAVAGLLF